MRKRILLISLLICLSILIFSTCALDGGNTYNYYPFETNKIPEDSFSAFQIPGSYFVHGAPHRGGNYYYYSFYSDGKIVSVPASNATGLMPLSESITTGTWDITDNIITISIANETLTGEKLFLHDKYGDYVGWAIKPTYNTEVHFRKISDKFINTDIYTNKTLLHGLWARTDDYGRTYGYRFLSNGKAWTYSIESPNGIEEPYMINNNKLRLNNSIFKEYNYALIGQYLCIGAYSFKCVDHVMPEISEIPYTMTDTELENSLIGTWIYRNRSSSSDVTNYYVFREDNTVWMLDSEGHYEGNWDITNGVFTIDVGTMHLCQKPKLKIKDAHPDQFVSFTDQNTPDGLYHWDKKLTSNIAYTDSDEYRNTKWESENILGEWKSSRYEFSAERTTSTTPSTGNCWLGKKTGPLEWSYRNGFWYLEGSKIYITWVGSKETDLMGLYLRYINDQNQTTLAIGDIEFTFTGQ